MLQRVQRPEYVKIHSQQQGRDENIKLLFDLIAAGSRHTRAELSRFTQLSPSTVSSLVEELIRDGLVVEGGLSKLSTGAGRRAVTLDINPGGRQIPVFSLDLRGVNYTLYDLKYHVLEQHFCPFQPEKRGRTEAGSMDSMQEAGEEYAAVIEHILNDCARYFEPAKAIGILVSYPGIFLEEENIFLLSSMEVMLRREAFDRLEAKLGLPVYMGNSSVNLAYAEKKKLDEIGSAVPDLMYVNICDGVGAGIIYGGGVSAHPNLIISELGHIVVEPNGRPCLCGNKGCLERYVNINAIRESVCRAAGKDADGGITLEEIARAYDSGDRAVSDALDTIATMLATGIGSAVSITRIKCIVIGGVEALGPRFLGLLQDRLNAKASNVLLRGVQLMYPRNGGNADSLGLAKYYIDKVFSIRNSV